MEYLAGLFGIGRRNRPECLREALGPLEQRGLFPSFPFGSDFTEVEQRLLPALGWLKAAAGSWRGRLGLLRALVRPGAPVAGEDEALLRMDLVGQGSLQERMLRRMVLAGLRRTAKG